MSNEQELIGRLIDQGEFVLCVDCGHYVAINAQDRHRYEHDYHDHLEAERARISEEIRERAKMNMERRGPPRKSGGMTVIDVPTTGTVASRPRNEPLYSHRTVAPPYIQTKFFTSDEPDDQCNLGMVNGMLPVGSFFFAYGLSLIPDEGSDPETVRMIRNEGVVWLLSGWGATQSDPTHILNELPARIVTQKRQFSGAQVLADPEEDLAGLVPMHRISISGRPIEFPALYSLEVRLILRNPVKVPIKIMAVIHGLRLTGAIA